MSKKTIESLAGRLADAVPDRLRGFRSKSLGLSSEIDKAGLRGLKTDLENNFKVVLETAFEKMELVSRDEFDVQRKVLARSREKLDRLERELAAIQTEKKSNKDDS